MERRLSHHMGATHATDPAPDASLADAYLGGDEQAAAALVARHAPALARFLYSSGAASGDLDDLVQESLYRAFRKLDSWRQSASFRSWLFSIAANLLRDEARRRKGRIMLSLEDRDVAAAGGPDADLDASDTAGRLRRAIGRLPRLQREVFLLRAQEGLDYSEIAASLGTTPGAARVHYHHAVKRLKEAVT